MGNKLKNLKGSLKDKTNNKDNLITLASAVAAIVLLIVACILKSKALAVILAAAAVVAAGYDIGMKAYACVKEKNYFDYSCVMVVAVIIGFVAGGWKDAALVLIVFKLCSLLLDAFVAHSKKTALNYVSDENSEDKEKLNAILNDPDVLKTSAENKLGKYTQLIIQAGLIVAVLYAVLLPLISDITFAVSFRRGAMIMLLTSTMPILVALPVCAFTGISYSAAYGVFVKKAASLENMARLNTVIFDKTDVFSDGSPKLDSVLSPILSPETFTQLAAYVAYKSEQRIASSIVAAYKGKINPDIIEDFVDIPGGGMSITVRGSQLCLGTKELMDTRGIDVPVSDLYDGIVLYMSIGEKYAGRLLFKEKINPYSGTIVSDFNKTGAVDCVLITEDGREVSESFARQLKVHELYFECDTEQKLEIVDNFAQEADKDATIMYVTAENLNEHTAADIDAKVGFDSEDADMLMNNICVFGLPVVYSTALRTVQIEKVNLIMSLAIKLIVLLLAVSGCATMWFVIFADYIAAFASIICAGRITDAPLIDIIKEKRNK